MKRYLLCLFVIAMVFAGRVGYAQTFTKAQIEEMQKRIRTMTPAQMMRFRDSLMKKVIAKQAAALPNGNQLLQKHTFDTTYTTVSFSYSKKSSGQGGNVSYSCNGVARKAPVLFEGNGHTVVHAGFNPRAMPGATEQMDRMAAALKKSQKYMTAAQSSAAGSLMAQMGFSGGAVNDNSINGSVTSGDPYVVVNDVDKMVFSFDYDPVQHFSTIGVGANVNVTRFTEENGKREAFTDVMGIGGSATTDMSKATILGGTAPPPDPTAAWAKVTKTSNGFRISYTKITHYDTGDVTEIINATIGEPILDYEAVIQPYKFDYLHWLPKGPKVDGSDDKGDDSSRFTIFVQDKDNPTKQYPGNFTVKWKLKEVTRYPGYCSNYPLPVDNPNKDKDLMISDSMKTDFHFKSVVVNDSVASGKTNDGILSIVRIRCMDYAAWGKLYAEVTLEDGRVLIARPFYRATDNTSPSPMIRTKINWPMHGR